MECGQNQQPFPRALPPYSTNCTKQVRDPTPAETLNKALQAAREWERAQLNTVTPQPPSSNQIPDLEPSLVSSPELIICNTDGACDSRSLQAGMGWVFLDASSTEINRGACSRPFVASASMAEALAIREALFHAIAQGFTSIWLRSDAQALIKAISMKRGPTELHGVLSDIDSLASSFLRCRFSFLPRSQNGLADSIAKAHLLLNSGSRLN
ncbi:hypothetical protein DY000_02053481 [Brassica cretica]|uniref:RNase H type-1 domain-containing protein n=1 Tax=Brassica cretica TaxID=69181 RepID=A0ABQ7AEY9_BRACR|nr:hypothetical protein DY000_02053481 [Brassica cretica]